MQKRGTGLSFSSRSCYNRNNGQNPAHRPFFGGGVLFIAIKRKTLLLFGLAAIFFVIAAVRLSGSMSLPAFRADQEVGRVYVLDAGHGGEDGGALSQSGVKESDINLDVTRKLDALLMFLGKKTLLTREDDVSIYSADAETLRQKKVSDLRNRVALVNAAPDAVLVSIHQNSLPQAPGVHGAQVFYGTVEPGAALAGSVQNALNQSVNAGNEKHEKKIDPSIYLMKNVNCPAILVECGFLSNAEETGRLQQPEHQKTLAVAIASGVLSAETEETEREGQ